MWARAASGRVDGGSLMCIMTWGRLTWLELRPVGPTAQVVFVDEATREDSWDTEEDKTLISGNGLLDVQVDRDALDLDDQRLRKTRCLASKFSKLKQDHHAAVTVHIPFPEHQKPLPDGELFINSLMNPEVLEKSLLKNTLFTDPDVLVLSWDIRHFPFGPGTLEAVTVGQVNTGLDYSEKIHALSKRLVDPYQSYLAVHWRMETVPPAMLPDCAEALVDTLNTLLADPILGQDIKTVWLASDFPWPISSSSSITLDESMRLNDPQQDVFQDDSTEQNPLMQIDVSARRSNTFRAVSPDHIRAIEVVKGAFRPGGALHGLTLTGVSEELDRVRKESESGGGGGSMLEDDDEQDVLLEDPGVLGILDKIAAMRAAVFVSGAKRCGRVSTFTRQITDYRANAKGSTQRNVVEVFG
uniref:Uncharacterized protein n=1 Tax=Antrodiella citrinella TaxID=2447956 RepID=A0A4S4M8I2_9APHY